MRAPIISNNKNYDAKFTDEKAPPFDMWSLSDLFTLLIPKTKPPMTRVTIMDLNTNKLIREYQQETATILPPNVCSLNVFQGNFWVGGKKHKINHSFFCDEIYM